jgi:serine/threonine-protein kinase RsbW
MNKISIEIPSIMENIRIVESFIDNARDKFKIDDDIYGNIMIAVMEAVCHVRYYLRACKPSKMTQCLQHATQ